ncbi:hypothetical protein ILYODFUR_007770 [Ilyodon furcidens]|uniref:Uncharacterized protein n=1 Tax=Ilyodon furcidens TaxID=33524 RepID=A0ABV0SYR9_9TELE
MFAWGTCLLLVKSHRNRTHFESVLSNPSSWSCEFAFSGHEVHQVAVLVSISGFAVSEPSWNCFTQTPYVSSVKWKRLFQPSAPSNPDHSNRFHWLTVALAASGQQI